MQKIGIFLLKKLDKIKNIDVNKKTTPEFSDVVRGMVVMICKSCGCATSAWEQRLQ